MATRIEFYVLATAGEAACLATACRLVDKARSQELSVWIRTASAAQSATIDRELWTWRRGSFIAHRIHAPGRRPWPVLIGTGAPPESHRALLLNLADDVPDGFEACSRLIEIVDAREGVLAASRARYKVYRDRGFAPSTVRL